ncbi:MAG: HAD family phosphatase [Bacteroidales bacterium]|jgi:Cof subfamily protein (haloacid dehalogenase superfamily)|nr:Cof-type HAD-IIB family hydrolase [Bacteroidales bacterium]MCK9500018.1 Cof-type HAD-IIB family hydrolase [Bacteroidales bacterium]MDY0314016.1 HAD family hydrolase [Bacteroidales bacterium]NLB86521.1 HAD family phosphatase [Bacteroidales bacterium]
MKQYVKMFVSDFDGTLANNKSIVSEETINLLKKLEEIPILRLIATGRNLFSFKNLIKPDFPIDYLVFSSGIGIYDWKNKEIIQSNQINSKQTKKIYDYLVKEKYDFMVQLPVPNNHYFHHFSSANPSPDFLSRITYYETKGIKPIINCPENASQFVVICQKENGQLELISKKFPELKVVKATSPLDNKSIWIEILPPNISKASGIEFIRKLKKIELKNIITVGNDYYDLDMLNYSLKENSYLVENAPEEIKNGFKIIESNENEGVAKLLKRIYNSC